MASAGMTGVIPKDLKPFDRIHILNIGGLIGQCKDFNILLGGPTECEVIGSIVDNKNKNINIDQFKKLKITNKLKTKVPVIAVLGTGIDSGKTTVSSFMIKVLKSYFKSSLSISQNGSFYYSMLGYIPAPWTIYENIYKVMPSQFIEFNSPFKSNE